MSEYFENPWSLIGYALAAAIPGFMAYVSKADDGQRRAQKYLTRAGNGNGALVAAEQAVIGSVHTMTYLTSRIEILEARQLRYEQRQSQHALEIKALKEAYESEMEILRQQLRQKNKEIDKLEQELARHKTLLRKMRQRLQAAGIDMDEDELEALLGQSEAAPAAAAPTADEETVDTEPLPDPDDPDDQST